MGSRFSRSACVALAFVAMILLPACQSAPAGQPASITYNDVQTLPADTLTARLMGQLGSLLTPAPPPPRWRRFVGPDRFSDTWLSTPPRLDETGDFCTYDLLRVKLAPDVRDDDPDADTPTHAIGLESSAWFTPASEGAKDCSGLHPSTAHYFESDDPIYAWLDFRMLKDALARLQAAPADFRLDCAETDHCSDLYKAIKAETLWDIRSCKGAYPEGDCRHYSWREPEYVEMDIIFDTTAPERRLVRIHIEPGVIVN